MIKRKRLRKGLLFALGALAVALGFLGIFVPLLPTTPFLLLAAACFIRSSDRAYRWLLTHPWFGSYIRSYREHHAITLQIKIFSISLLWAALGYSMLAVVTALWLRLLLAAIGIGVTIHLLSLRTLTKEMRASLESAPLPE